MHKSEANILLRKVREAIESYHLSLDRKEHASPSEAQLITISELEKMLANHNAGTNILLGNIRATIAKHRLSIDSKENVNAAMIRFMTISSIEKTLGMPWIKGKTLDDYNALHMEIEIGDETDKGKVIHILTNGRVVTDRYPCGSFRLDAVRFISRQSMLETGCRSA